MAWTAPRTWTTAEVVTAAMMNTHVRDNLLETSAATVTTAGDISYADAANSMGSRLAIASTDTGFFLGSTGTAPVWRQVDGMIGDITYTGTPPTSFSNLNTAPWGNGTEVAVTVTTGAQALIHYGARYTQHTTAGSNVQISYQVTGATTIVASSAFGTIGESSATVDFIPHGRSHWQDGLTPGSNKFILNAMASTAAAVANIGSPYIIVQAF